MRKTKAKRGAFWQNQMLPFVVLWAIGIGLAGAASRLWPIDLGSDVRGMLTLFTGVIFTGLVQVVLVERLLKRPMRGWLFYTIPSVLVTLFLSAVRPEMYFGYDKNPLVNLALNAPTSLLQYVWLRQRVKRAWLWPLLTIPLLYAFSSITYSDEYYRVLKIVTLLSVGVVQGGLMHYFWQNPKDTDKARFESGSAEEFDGERIERLRERERPQSTSHEGDRQGLQSDAL